MQHGLRHGERPCQCLTPLGQPAVHMPKAHQRACCAERHFGGFPAARQAARLRAHGVAPVRPLARPRQRRPDIVVLLLEPIQPRHLLRALELRLRLLRQPHEVAGMLLLQGCRFATRRQLLPGVLMDGFQQPEARLAVGTFALLEQALPQEGLHRCLRVPPRGAGNLAHAGDGFQRTPAHERGQAPEHLLLLRVQQGVAPINGHTQRLVPGRQVACAPARELEAAAQCRPHLPQREQAGAGGRQFQRQGQPVQPHADRGQVRSILRRQGKVGMHLARALHKERHRRAMRQGGRVERAAQQGQLEGRHQEAPLPLHMQRLAAGHQHLQPGAVRKHRQQVWCGIQHLLEVVQHQ